MLRYIDSNYDLPNKAEVRLWTHRDNDEETVRAMLDASEDAEEPEDAEEDLEDARHLYRMVTNRPYD